MEVEIKYVLTDNQRTHLQQTLGNPEWACLQVDTYFGGTPDGCSLRIRQETYSNEDRAYITMKRSVESGDYAMIDESEPEIEPDDVPGYVELFGAIGFAREITVEKRRTSYTYADATITLDNVTYLGHFMEVEILAEGLDEHIVQQRLDMICKSFGFDRLEVASGSYPAMLKHMLS